jgi:hypothetical protein
MRYQERIYPQTNVSALRNKDITIFNMSTDICIFEQPQYDVIGAGKINCVNSTSAFTYTITGTSQIIPFTFDFSANTNSFSANNATFRYEIYKYSNSLGGFSSTPVYKSDVKTQLTSTSSFTDSITASTLSLDGDYIIKGYFNFPVCTDFLSKLGKSVSTFNYLGGTQFGIYNKDLDFYFIAFKEAQKPEFSNYSTGTPDGFALTQTNLTKYKSYSVSGSTTYDNIVMLPTDYSGDFVLTVNGLVLSKGLDYTINDYMLILNDKLNDDDIITLIYTTINSGKLVSDVIEVQSPIVSGVTNEQGENQIYYNTTTSKYEVYTSTLPRIFSDVVFTLNGAVLSNGVDFYQSVSNSYRIILVGEIIPTDIISITYPPNADIFGQIYSPDQVVVWSVPETITDTNGLFTLEISKSNDFSTIYYSATTQYITERSFYNLPVSFSGDMGSKYYTRVKNEKNYNDICGKLYTTTKYSDTLVSVVSTNSTNSY